MIKFIGTFVGAVMLSSFAHAATTNDCGVNHSRMNPTELSSYQECWLDTHRADETHGVLGSLFWVKAGGEYYSTQIKLLATAGQREAFLAGIEEDVTATLDAANTVVEESVRIEVIKEVIVVKEVEVDNAETIAELKQAYADLDEAKDALNAAEEALAAAEAELATVDQQIIDAIEEAKENAKAQAFAMFSDAFANVGNTDNEWSHVVHGEQAIDIHSLNGNKTFSLVRVGSNTYNTYNFGISSIRVGASSHMNALEKLMEQIHDDAYNAGYDDGYATGYIQGFADGVASVQ